MEQRNFIFLIDAEQHFNILVRIVATFNRQRIPLKEFSSHIQPSEERLRIMVSVRETKETAMKLSRKLDKEVDVFSVNVFEELS